jgi:hypothetical protein
MIRFLKVEPLARQSASKLPGNNGFRSRRAPGRRRFYNA